MEWYYVCKECRNDIISANPEIIERIESQKIFKDFKEVQEFYEMIHQEIICQFEEWMRKYIFEAIFNRLERIDNEIIKLKTNHNQNAEIVDKIIPEQEKAYISTRKIT